MQKITSSYHGVACVASISNQVITLKLGEEQNKWEIKGGGEAKRGNACRQTSQFWKMQSDISQTEQIKRFVKFTLFS